MCKFSATAAFLFMIVSITGGVGLSSPPASSQPAEPSTQPSPNFLSMIFLGIPADCIPEKGKSWDQFNGPRANAWIQKKRIRSTVSVARAVEAVYLVRTPPAADPNSTAKWRVFIWFSTHTTALCGNERVVLYVNTDLPTEKNAELEQKVEVYYSSVSQWGTVREPDYYVDCDEATAVHFKNLKAGKIFKLIGKIKSLSVTIPEGEEHTDNSATVDLERCQVVE